MKIEIEYWILIAIFTLTIVLNLILTTNNFSPYHPNNYFSHEFVYEGFETNKDENEKTSETKENKDKENEGKIPEKDDKKKMSGFEGFYTCPK